MEAPRISQRPGDAQYALKSSIGVVATDAEGSMPPSSIPSASGSNRSNASSRRAAGFTSIQARIEAVKLKIGGEQDANHFRSAHLHFLD